MSATVLRDEDVTAWVGRAPCGCALYAAVEEEPGTAAAVSFNRDLAGLRKKGWTIERRTVGWVRAGGLNFECPHRKRRRSRRNPEQLPLRRGGAESERGGADAEQRALHGMGGRASEEGPGPSRQAR